MALTPHAEVIKMKMRIEESLLLRSSLATRAGLVLCLAVTLFSLAACKDKIQPPITIPVADAPANPPLSYAGVVDRAGPAVVTILAERRVRAPSQYPYYNDPFFRYFFGSAVPRHPAEVREKALGSGVIVNADGYIVTNHHVIDGAEEIKTVLSDNRSFDARVVGSDPASDLAVLKISAHDLPVLPLADSDQVRVGDIALAIGSPLGLTQTVTAGIISAKGRSTGVSDGSFADFLQTDAPINQGNSGGALINTNAQLVGINSQILSPTGTNIGIGFAIPSNMARNVMTQLIERGQVRRGRLGIAVLPVNSDDVSKLGLSGVRGVIVKQVEKGGPAERAGIREGDVILSFNGTPVNDSNGLRNQVASSQPGTEVTLTIFRDGHEQQVPVTLGEFIPPTENAG
jgi:Do/DeqQ family serine protease